MKNKKAKATKSPVAEAIRNALDVSEKRFHEKGQLEPLKVQYNPASGKSKLTLYDDCEDGMNSRYWKIPQY
jgi:hypothetical protein